MGVAGSGKTTVGRLLAQEMGWEFYEGDQYHPPENIAKMASGIPLGDADRWPWLRRLRDLIAGLEADGGSAVIACSALKQSYRDLLGEGGAAVTFVYLKGGGELIGQRLARREGHFMPTSLLNSQFADLEEPQDAITAEVDQPPEAIAAQLRAAAAGGGAKGRGPAADLPGCGGRGVAGNGKSIKSTGGGIGGPGIINGWWGWRVTESQSNQRAV